MDTRVDPSKALVVVTTTPNPPLVATLSLLAIVVILSLTAICVRVSQHIHRVPEPAESTEIESSVASSPPRLRTTTVVLPSGAVISVRQVTPRNRSQAHHGPN